MKNVIVVQEEVNGTLGGKKLTFSYLLQKGNKFAHKIAKNPSWERVEGGSEGDAAHQEDDISSSQICCNER